MMKPRDLTTADRQFAKLFMGAAGCFSATILAYRILIGHSPQKPGSFCGHYLHVEMPLGVLVASGKRH